MSELIVFCPAGGSGFFGTLAPGFGGNIVDFACAFATVGGVFVRDLFFFE